MTEEERFLFDLQGYLVIENAIEPDALAAMNAWLDSQVERDPQFRGQTGNAHLENPLTWGPHFLALVDNPRVLPYLKELLGDQMRLDHDYAIFLRPGHEGLPLHGPTLYPYDPCHYYHCVQGQMFCGLTVATYALSDVPPGTGGLALIPGSHKSQFRVPESICKFERASPVVKQVPTKAGDCVIFTEALIHGTLPWKGPGERRTLFYKYAPGNLAWTNQVYFPPKHTPDMRGLESELTETQRLLLQPPSAKDHRRPLP
jgi:ectoine hydroxylase-related dioxygenase (phytanoyl-CoA dioxygenase family)